MRALSSCSAIIAAALLLTSTPALATDAEAGGAGRPASPARPSMVGLPAKDSASSLPLGWMEFVTVGDEAYFVAEGQRPGELWRSNGTTEGTVLVTDRLATEREDPITHMTAVGDELYFSGEHRETGAELWRTDGTAEGTALVVDLMPGEANSYPRNIVALDDLVLFWAKGAGRSCGLWRTDGTPAGTTLVRGVDGFEVRSPDSHHCPYPETALRIGDAAILWFNTGGRHEVWRSDGSDEGTTLLRAFPHRSDWREWVLRADGGAYFTADDGEHGRELWRIDGTADGTTLFADVAPGPTGADPEPVGVVAGMVFFIADGPKRSRALWVSDGTEDGTTMLRKLKSGWRYDWSPAIRCSISGLTTAVTAASCGAPTGRGRGPGWSATSPRAASRPDPRATVRSRPSETPHSSRPGTGNTAPSCGPATARAKGPASSWTSDPGRAVPVPI